MPIDGINFYDSYKFLLIITYLFSLVLALPIQASFHTCTTNPNSLNPMETIHNR